VRVWRLCQRAHAARAFDGTGAALYPGRWNHRGERVVYAASTLSLAALELLVHTDPDLLPPRLVAFAVDVPDDPPPEEIDVATLPRGWRRHPPGDATRDLGSAWLARGATVALLVPSAVVPSERNVVLSPAHAHFARVRIGKPEPFVLDPRLLTARS
jgi:RES domain-containing protein